MLQELYIQSSEITWQGASLLYHPHFANDATARRWFAALEQEIEWKQEPILMFGKWVMQPRKTAWYGNPEAVIRYSGIEMKPLPFTPALLEIKQQIEALCNHSFNGVLLNLYRDGNDSMGWHSDDEKELGTQPTIASISLGAEREFQFKHKTQPDLGIKKLTLHNGSLLIMRGETQTYWKHQIPKRKGITQPRINLTFRKIVK